MGLSRVRDQVEPVEYIPSGSYGYSNNETQIVYFTGDSSQQEQIALAELVMQSSTAYRLKPAKVWFFSQRTSETDTKDSSFTQPIVVTDVYEQFLCIHHFFQFKKSEWAQIFGVSRVAIYGWLDKTMKPSGEHRIRIEQLFKLTREIPDITADDTIKLFAHHHIAKLNATLLDVVASPATIVQNRSILIQVLIELRDKSRSKQQELEQLAATSKASEDTFAYNIDQLLS